MLFSSIPPFISTVTTVATTVVRPTRVRRLSDPTVRMNFAVHSNPNGSALRMNFRPNLTRSTSAVIHDCRLNYGLV